MTNIKFFTDSDIRQLSDSQVNPEPVTVEEQTARPEQQSPEQQITAPADNTQEMQARQGRNDGRTGRDGFDREQVAMLNNAESGQNGAGPQSDPEKSKPEQVKPKQKVYELKNDGQNTYSNAGVDTTGVTMLAILGALAAVTVFAKGYLFK